VVARKNCEPPGIPNACNHIVKNFMILSLAWGWLFKPKHVALALIHAFIIQLCWRKYILIKWVYRINTQRDDFIQKRTMKFIIMLFSPKVSYLPTLQPNILLSTMFLSHLIWIFLVFTSSIIFIHIKFRVLTRIYFPPFIIWPNNYLLKLCTSFYLPQIGGTGLVVAWH